MSEQTPSNYKPYEWGEEAFGVPRSLRRPSQESEEIQRAQHGNRVAHPNIADAMETVEGHVRLDANRGRNDIRRYDNTYWDVSPNPSIVSELNQELRRDEEERQRIVAALGELAILLEQRKSNTPRWGKTRHERSIRFMEDDEIYLKQRLNNLSHDGRSWNDEPSQTPEETLAEQNAAWDETTRRFMNAPTPDGGRVIDILYQEALKEAQQRTDTSK